MKFETKLKINLVILIIINLWMVHNYCCEPFYIHDIIILMMEVYMKNLKEALSKISGGKLLDVGTGRGEFIHLLTESLKNFTEIIGIDSSTLAIDYCKKLFIDDKINFIEMNALHMEFVDNTFDTVCISNSLHHLENYPLILSEMKRVLKPNGQFIISEMFSDDQTNEQLSHVKLHHWSAEIDTLIGIKHDRTFKRNEIINIANSLGLDDIKFLNYCFTLEDSKSNEIINHFIKLIDKISEKINTHKDYLNMKAEGEKIKNWIIKYGFQSATEVMIIGIKKNDFIE